MSEFKGTKGTWSYEYDGDGMRFNEISCFIDDVYENYKEDALLISKSPEMLEALKVGRQAIMELMNHEEGWEEEYTHIDELIKSATELK